MHSSTAHWAMPPTFTQPLQDFVNEHAWGSVWAREGLPLKTRSLITLATLTALKCRKSSRGMCAEP